MTKNEEIKKATNIETMNIIKGNVMHYFYPLRFGIGDQF